MICPSNREKLIISIAKEMLGEMQKRDVRATFWKVLNVKMKILCLFFNQWEANEDSLAVVRNNQSCDLESIIWPWYVGMLEEMDEKEVTQ